jgi:hypothetical protein
MLTHHLSRYQAMGLRIAAALLIGGLLPLHARKFHEDDPLLKEPPARNVQQVLSRKLSDYYDLLLHLFGHPGERGSKARPIPAQGVNTLGEVPDNSWYTNRHYLAPMSTQDLVRGPGDDNAPSPEGPWTVIAAKTEGITPGFTIRDGRGRRYVVKFDPVSNPEMTTAAEIISTKFFYALGYHVAENYLVEFSREQLVLGEDVQLRDQLGKPRKMSERDITEILLKVPRRHDGKYRAVASLYISGKNVGPFRFFGTRKDDPNDIFPHEHIRELRGYHVFCAWLDHDDSRAINTTDFLVQESGIQFIRHYLIDFGSTLGSASTKANSPRSGFEYFFTWKEPAVQLLTLGLVVPHWAKAKYPQFPSVGRFESKEFDPERWVPEYPNPAFLNRLPDDEFWAAKQVMNFDDDQIRAVVKSAGYSDPRAEQWVADRLIERRDKIGRAYFKKVLPLDRFRVVDGRLAFEDLAAKYHFAAGEEYSVQWSHFNNEAETKTILPNETMFTIPALRGAELDQYFAADIRGADSKKNITVFLHHKNSQIAVVGIDRTW